jgi:integrase
LSIEQIGLIVSNLRDDQEQLLTLFVAVTGVRIGEALALRWMDFKGSEIHINHTLYKGQLKQPKTESSRRAIRLAPIIEGALLVHRDKSKFQSPSDYIFCRPDGQHLYTSALSSHLHKAMDRAGIKRETSKFGFHIFRHTAGTLLYTRSRDLKLVQGALGHSNISTTSDIYVHLHDPVVAEGALMLAEEILSKCDLTVTKNSRMVS